MGRPGRQEIIIGQKHNPVADYTFIHSILEAISDPRYIRVNGRPLLLVYRADLLSNPTQTLDLWRQAALLAGLGELYIAGVRFRTMSAAKWGLDALVEFPPHHFPAPSLSPGDRKALEVTEGFSGDIRDFERGVHALVAHPAPAKDAPLFPVSRLPGITRPGGARRLRSIRAVRRICWNIG